MYAPAWRPHSPPTWSLDDHKEDVHRACHPTHLYSPPPAGNVFLLSQHEQPSELTRNPRVTVRRDGPPGPHGTCVVYWMQRAQRGIDNPALDVAVEAANA